jgi:hypothetical protein
MSGQAVFAFDLPWGVVLPLTAGLAATGMAVVLSRFFLGGRRPSADPAAAETDEKPPPDYDPFIEGSASEQRGTLRRGGNPVAVLLSEKDSGRPPMHGWVIDRSMGGLCLTVDEAIPVGTALTVRAIKAPSAAPGVDVEVKSCRRGTEAWELGCQFLKTPPWAVLLLFG